VDEEVEGERQTAEEELRQSVPAEQLTTAQLKSLLAAIGDAVNMLAEADATLKAQLYAELDLRLEYRPDEDVVIVEAPIDAWGTERVGGGTPTITPRHFKRGRLNVAR
jgi:hypothetical protein